MCQQSGVWGWLEQHNFCAYYLTVVCTGGVVFPQGGAAPAAAAKGQAAGKAEAPVADGPVAAGKGKVRFVQVLGRGVCRRHAAGHSTGADTLRDQAHCC